MGETGGAGTLHRDHAVGDLEPARPKPGWLIEPVDAKHLPGIQALNARLKAGGSRWAFYAGETLSWLPWGPDAPVWRRAFVLTEEATGLVRGGYVLKHEAFLVAGQRQVIGWLQGPVAESAVDRSLKGLGSMLVNDSIRRYPMQPSWGANSIATPSYGSGPMILKVLNTGRFLREAAELQSPPSRAAVARFAAATGLGWLAIGAAQTAMRMSAPPSAAWDWEEVPTFGAWADEVWAAAAPTYHLIAMRDAATLNLLVPEQGYPEGIRIRVSSKGRTVGWAVLRDRKLSGDRQFGNLRAGSIIDALAVPGCERQVAAAAVDALQRRGVDIIGACFMHANWIKALRAAGCLIIPRRRNIGFSDALVAAAGGLAPLMAGSHFSLIDSDGPRIF